MEYKHTKAAVYILILQRKPILVSAFCVFIFLTNLVGHCREQELPPHVPTVMITETIK